MATYYKLINGLSNQSGVNYYGNYVNGVADTLVVYFTAYDMAHATYDAISSFVMDAEDTVVFRFPADPSYYYGQRYDFHQSGTWAMTTGAPNGYMWNFYTTVYNADGDYSHTQHGHYYVYTQGTTNILFQYGPYVPPCFTADTLIALADGSRKAMRDLQVGDLVMTRDHGAQPVRWIGSSPYSAETLAQFPERRPIRFRAGALGNDKDMLISPQHRVHITGEMAKILGGDPEEGLLVAAKALVNDSSVTVENANNEVVYYHILFDRHELVFSDGVWTESFLPDHFMMDEMGRATRDEVIAFFPQLEFGASAYSPPARQVMRPGQVRVHLRKNNGGAPLVLEKQ